MNAGTVGAARGLVSLFAIRSLAAAAALAAAASAGNVRAQSLYDYSTGEAAPSGERASASRAQASPQRWSPSSHLRNYNERTKREKPPNPEAPFVPSVTYPSATYGYPNPARTTPELAVRRSGDRTQSSAAQSSPDSSPQLDTEALRTIQTELQALGYDPGPADGIFGGRTGQALQKFQTDHGIEEDQVLGPATLDALKAVARKKPDSVLRSTVVGKLMNYGAKGASGADPSPDRTAPGDASESIDDAMTDAIPAPMMPRPVAAR